MPFCRKKMLNLCPFLEISFGELNEHTTANFSVHIYSYSKYTLKFFQSRLSLLSYTATNHSSLKKNFCGDQDCKRSDYLKQKKTNSISIYEIKTSL